MCDAWTGSCGHCHINYTSTCAAHCFIHHSGFSSRRVSRLTRDSQHRSASHIVHMAMGKVHIHTTPNRRRLSGAEGERHLPPEPVPKSGHSDTWQGSRGQLTRYVLRQWRRVKVPQASPKYNCAVMSAVLQCPTYNTIPAIRHVTWAHARALVSMSAVGNEPTRSSRALLCARSADLLTLSEELSRCQCYKCGLARQHCRWSMRSCISVQLAFSRGSSLGHDKGVRAAFCAQTVFHLPFTVERLDRVDQPTVGE